MIEDTRPKAPPNGRDARGGDLCNAVLRASAYANLEQSVEHVRGEPASLLPGERTGVKLNATVGGREVQPRVGDQFVAVEDFENPTLI